MKDQELSDKYLDQLGPTFENFEPTTAEKNLLNFALHSIMSGKDFNGLENDDKFEIMCNLFSKKFGSGDPYMKHFQYDINKGSCGKTISELIQSEKLTQKLKSLIKPWLSVETESMLLKASPNLLNEPNSNKEKIKELSKIEGATGSANSCDKSSSINQKLSSTNSSRNLSNHSSQNHQITNESSYTNSELSVQPSTEELIENYITECGIKIYQNDESMYLVPFQIKVKQITNQTTGLIFKKTSNSLDIEIRQFKFLLTKSDISKINQIINHNNSNL